MAETMKLSEVIETLEALTKSPGADEFDKGARAARLDALDLLRPLAASPPAREEAPAEGAGERVKSAVLQDKLDRLADEYGELLTEVEALRNRTSEPEAGALAWRYLYGGAPEGAWSHSDQPPQKEWADQCRNVQPLYTHRAPASADKLRLAVEALEKADALASRSHDALEEVRDFLRERHPGTDLYEVVTSALYDLRTRPSLSALNKGGK